MILAGDVGGTKCNLALFSESGGKLTPVFRQRFASKEFAQFDLIVKEFYRLAGPHLLGKKVVAAAFGVADVNRLEYARRHGTALRIVAEADEIEAAVSVLKAHADYRAPGSLLAGIRALIDSGRYRVFEA